MKGNFYTLKSMEEIIERIEVANVNISAINKTEFTFGQNNENIEKRFVTGIECYDASSISKSTDQNATINASAFKKGYLVLKVDDEDKVNKIPLIALNPQYNNGLVKRFNKMKVALAQCRVVFPDNSSLASGEDLIVVFHLVDNK